MPKPSLPVLTLVNLGPGDPGLVTLRARDALRGATAIHVMGGSPELVALASSFLEPEDVEKVVAGAPTENADLEGAVIAHGAAHAEMLAATAIAEARAQSSELILLRVPGVSLEAHTEAVRPLPLFGKRVLTLRAKEQAQDAESILYAFGATPVAVPALVIAPPPDPARLEQAVREASTYGFIVFTSANGVTRFFNVLCKQMGKDARSLAPAKIAAIGPKTAEALRTYGVRADVVAKDFVGEALAAELAAVIGETKTRVLLPRALVARDVVPDSLRALGHTVDVVAAYETRGPAEEDAERIRRALADKEIHAVLFTSSSTVTHVTTVLGPTAASILASVCVVSIGPVTSKTASDLGITVHVTASVYTVEGAVAALASRTAREAAAAPA